MPSKLLTGTASFLGTMVEFKKFRMLAGMVRCGCGHTMTTAKVCNNKKTKQYYAYYFCMGRREKRNGCREPYIRLERVEAVVWEKLQQLVRDPELLRRTIEQARGSEDRAHLELEREPSPPWRMPRLRLPD